MYPSFQLAFALVLIDLLTARLVLVIRYSDSTMAQDDSHWDASLTEKKQKGIVAYMPHAGNRSGKETHWIVQERKQQAAKTFWGDG